MNQQPPDSHVHQQPNRPATGLKLLAELEGLLRGQLERAADGDYESLEALARSARRLLDRLATVQLDNDLAVLDHLHQIRRLHGQLQHLLQQARDLTRSQLGSARDGSRALRAYGQSW